MQFKIQTILTTTLLVITANFCFAQVIVSENQKVGVGNENTYPSKMKVHNTEWDYTLRLDNLTDTNSSKYGQVINTDDKGTGAKYGMHNSIYQNTSATKESVGITNHINAYGTSLARGIGISNLVQHGIGRKYGIINSIIQSSAATLQSYGVYNYLEPKGGDSYGVYSTIKRLENSKKAYGYYSYLRDSETQTTHRNYGIYSRIDHEGFIDNFGGYYYLNTKGLAAEGETGRSYGLFVSVAGSGDTERIGIYSTIGSGSGHAGKFIGDVHISGTLTNPSDERLKDNIQPLGDAMKIINQLQPKSYTYKKTLGQGNDANTLRFGFLAGDLRKVLPNLVHSIEGAEIPIVDDSPQPSKEESLENQFKEKYKKLEDYQAINYIDIIPVLAQAIKEQQAEIEKLKSQQKSEISALRKSIETLKQEVQFLKK